MKVSLKELNLLSSDIDLTTLHNQAKTGLRAIWEINEHLKCPVVGTCLSIDDHKKILKKTGYSPKGLQPYEIHRVLMSQLQDKNNVSRKVDSFIRFKFRDAITKYSDISESEFLKVWKTAIKGDQFGALFYVAAIRWDLGPNAMDQIAGEVHVLSHVNISLAQKNQQIINIETTNSANLKKELLIEQKTKKELRHENKVLEAKLLEMTQQANNTKKELDDYLSKNNQKLILASENKAIVVEIDILKSTNQRLNDHHLKQNKTILILEEQNLEMQNSNIELSKELEQLIDHFSKLTNCNTDNSHCDNRDLCSKRVLLVGGMTKFEHLYRNLVEKSGGYFDYHDGYVKKGAQNLDSKVGRSDIVLCPVNCNSHGACLQVKKLCQKHNKSVKMLAGSSISAISTALFSDNSVDTISAQQ